MRDIYRALGAAGGIAILSACTSGQSGIEPPVTSVNPQTTTVLQFRVGTAHVGASTYLNTLVTYRQPNGLSGTLVNTPTITGPAGFTVPAAASAGTDAGTNHISATPPTQPGTVAVKTTFGTIGGAFAYGFAPANAATTGAPTYATNQAIGNTSSEFGCAFCGEVGPYGGFFNVYTQPIYLASAARVPYLLGPPAVPDFHNGTFPTGFLGYDSGFMMFAATAVAGTYAMHLTVPSATIGVNSAVFDVTAALTSVVPLGSLTAPTITPTLGAGGAGTGAATFTVPAAPAGVTNQILYIVDISGANVNGSFTPTFYSCPIPAAGGTCTFTATSGPKNAGGVAGPPFKSGDDIFAYTAGADYDILALAPPGNTAQTPTLPAQADVTVSSVVTAPVP